MACDRLPPVGQFEKLGFEAVPVLERKLAATLPPVDSVVENRAELSPHRHRRPGPNRLGKARLLRPELGGHRDLGALRWPLLRGRRILRSGLVLPEAGRCGTLRVGKRVLPLVAWFS